MLAPRNPVEVVLQEDTLDYTPRPRSVALARNRAARLTGEWGQIQLVEDVRLLVSELATNALVHGHVRGRLFRVGLTLTDSVLRIAVTDARGERLPCAGEPAPGAAGGRGLQLVGAVSDRWGVQVRQVGKTVWCELATRRT
ncbi:ATP-binding protein [Streptomyces sp. NPDC004296]|uniref:ATP-binding protein n=1 Tax=Streptomyces sp. NPDC004296 TaxID=3364697 RepID=UPI0036A47010